MKIIIENKELREIIGRYIYERLAEEVTVNVDQLKFCVQDYYYSEINNNPNDLFVEYSEEI